MKKKGHFSSETYRFLTDLSTNNNREWFQVNKERYEEKVKRPALEFIEDFGVLLREISPHFRADPRARGGSLFRIYRDVRFSKDKSPYKTAVGIQFRHEAGKDAHAPGFYLHLEPRQSFVGLGIWRPDGKTLRKIRERVAGDPDSWDEAVSNPSFAERFELSGERLVRPPRGFDPTHPMVEALKWKDYVAMAPLTEEAVVGREFLETYATYCRDGLPFVSFLCRALGLSV